MTNGVGKLVEELEAAEEAVREQHGRVVLLRRQLAEELGLHPGPAPAAVVKAPVSQVENLPAPAGNGAAKQRKQWPGVRAQKILAVLNRGKRTSAEIADAIDCPRMSITWYLSQLVDAHKIRRVSRGVYRRVA